MKINVALSKNGLAQAISQVKAYSKNVRFKCKVLNERIAVYGAFVARISYSQAMYAGDNDVEVSVVKTRNGYKIIAKGQAVLFIEFGTGTINPEHPLGVEFGYMHGTYGKGQGNSAKHPNGWIYQGVQGNAGEIISASRGVYRTRGNPASKSMYYAGKDMRAELLTIAREIFGND